MGHRNDDEERDKETDAAIGDDGAGQHDGEDHAALAQAPGDDPCDGGH